MDVGRSICCWFVIIFIWSSAARLIAAEKCKVEQKYVCGIEDCNCRYVTPNTVSLSSLYKRFYAMFARQSDQYDESVCDKCEVFCIKEKHINCYQGACDQKGCICRDCWTGETCSKYENKNTPKFSEMMYKAEIDDGAKVGDQIIQVSAMDSDLDMCFDKENCPCGKIKFSITVGNTLDIFYIDPETGIISLNKEIFSTNHISPFILHVTAENSGMETESDPENRRSFAIVTISVSRKSESLVRSRRSVHHRSRRSVQINDMLTTEFEPVTNNSFFHAGCSILYRLHFAQNQSSSPQTLTGIKIGLTSTNLDINKDSFYLNGSVTNYPNVTKTDSNLVMLSIAVPLNSDNYMEIRFLTKVKSTTSPLARLEISFTMNATGHDNGTVQYGPKNSKTVFGDYPYTTFSRNTSGVVRVEETLDYDVNITLPYFNFSLTIELTTNINKLRFLSIESVEAQVESTSPVNAENPNPVPVKYTSAEDGVTSRVVLNFGEVKVLNKIKNENRISISFTVKVNDHYLLENASEHWIGIGISSGSDMLWVGQEKITIFKEEPFLIACITTVNNTAATRYFMNDRLFFRWSVTHANASYATAKNVKIVFIFANTTLLEGQISSDETGTPTTTITSSGQTQVEYSLDNKNVSKSSSINGSVVVKVKDENVPPLSDLNIEIKLHYQDQNSKDRPVKTYRPKPGYLSGVPKFNLTSNSSGRTIKVGKTVEITLQIWIKKITLSGNIEVILPVQNKTGIMRYVNNSFSVVSTGSNLQGTQLSNPKLTLYSIVNETKYSDRVSYNIGEVHNKNIDLATLSVSENNMVMIKFQAILEDTEHVTNGSKYWIGVGVRGGKSMVWIGELAFIADVPLNRRPRLQINAKTNSTDTVTQGAIVEYNVTVSHGESSDAHAYDVDVLWMLPTYTKFQSVHVNSHSMSFNQLQPQNNLLFKMSKLDFLEEPFVSFTVEMDPIKTLKPGKNFAVTPIALIYKDKGEQKSFYEPLVPMSISFTVPYPTSNDNVNEFYNRGFLVDNSSSEVYICKVSSKRNKPSCFWTKSKGAQWRAIDVLVINIIGIDSANNMVYGIGNNKKSYMKYVPTKGKWFSISKQHWNQVQSTLTAENPVIIEEGHENDGDPESGKVFNIANGEKWGANKIGVYYFSQSNWEKKAVWDCCF